MPNAICATEALPLVQVQTSLVSDTAFPPADAAAGFQLASTGNEQTKEGDGAPYVTVGPWLVFGNASDYEVRYSSPTPDVPNFGSPVDTWLSLGTTRFWENRETGVGIRNSQGTLEIRRASDSVVILSQPLQLFAESTF